MAPVETIEILGSRQLDDMGPWSHTHHDKRGLSRGRLNGSPALVDRAYLWASEASQPVYAVVLLEELERES